MELAEAAAHADALAREPGNEKELATLRAQWDDELEAAARSADYRLRGQAFRAIGQFRFRQKLELIRRGLEDESAAALSSSSPRRMSSSFCRKRNWPIARNAWPRRR